MLRISLNTAQGLLWLEINFSEETPPSLTLSIAIKEHPNLHIVTLMNVTVTQLTNTCYARSQNEKLYNRYKHLYYRAEFDHVSGYSPKTDQYTRGRPFRWKIPNENLKFEPLFESTSLCVVELPQTVINRPQKPGKRCLTFRINSTTGLLDISGREKSIRIESIEEKVDIRKRLSASKTLLCLSCIDEDQKRIFKRFKDSLETAQEIVTRLLDRFHLLLAQNQVPVAKFWLNLTKAIISKSKIRQPIFDEAITISRDIDAAEKILEAWMMWENKFDIPTVRLEALRCLWPHSKDKPHIRHHIGLQLSLADNDALPFIEYPYEKYLLTIWFLRPDEESPSHSVLQNAFRCAVHYAKYPNGDAPPYTRNTTLESPNANRCIFVCSMYQLIGDLIQILPKEKFGKELDELKTLFGQDECKDAALCSLLKTLQQPTLLLYLRKCRTYSSDLISQLNQYAKHPEREDTFDSIQSRIFTDIESWLEDPLTFERKKSVRIQLRDMSFRQAKLEQKVEDLTEENRKLKELVSTLVSERKKVTDEEIDEPSEKATGQGRFF